MIGLRGRETRRRYGWNHVQDVTPRWILLSLLTSSPLNLQPKEGDATAAGEPWCRPQALLDLFQSSPAKVNASK